MTSITQTDSGKALEYAVAVAMGKATSAPVAQDSPFIAAKAAYRQHPPDQQARFDRAAEEVAVFLLRCDQQFGRANRVLIQPDSHGRSGDVRDVVIQLDDQKEVGISAKNNHEAVKHSRLSDSIDFGKSWADHPVSSDYFTRVRPVFNNLRQLQAEGMLFRNITNKDGTIYLPVLTAFEDEFRQLCATFQAQFISRVFAYLLGTHDFYKVIKRDTENVVIIQSMNMGGSLGWGHRWQIPSGIDNIQRKAGSNSTLLITFTGGWQLSFRLHNAKSKVEPSLKFDITFTGMPPHVSRHEISLEVN